MSQKSQQPDLRHLTDQYELTEDELDTTLAAVMASHPDGEDLWVFGYGSLMWQPEFPFEERTLATIHGYHRSFCVYSSISGAVPVKSRVLCSGWTMAAAVVAWLTGCGRIRLPRPSSISFAGKW